jgi:hypothetical protein
VKIRLYVFKKKKVVTGSNHFEPFLGPKTTQNNDFFFFGSVELYNEPIKNQPTSAIHFVFLKIELSCYNKAANDPRWRTPNVC